MSTTKKYISVDAANDTTNDTIKMQNPNNEVHGTLYTKDSNNQQKDIREIFIKKDALENIDEIDVSEDSDPGFNIETIAERFNQMLNALKGTVPLILFLCGSSMAFGANTDGKAKLRNIGANQYVVTNEVDNVFQEWRNATNFDLGSKSSFNVGLLDPLTQFKFGEQTLGDVISGVVPNEIDPEYMKFKNARENITIGMETQINKIRGNSVAIGIPAGVTNYNDSVPNSGFGYDSLPYKYGYSWDFNGPAVAGVNATAFGAGAQARD